ncbi:MAG: nucleotidyltransferase family protein [Deltaproteobacteria bacterium]|nr:nucleotidyltransferase family protein [Deltaproteobacteria bacterium]
MIAILLCAGFATRMYPLTKNFPKPLLKVGGKHAIDYLMDQLIGFPQIESIHVVTNELFSSNFLEWQSRWKKLVKTHGIDLYLYNDGATSNENRLGAVKDLAFVLSSLKSTGPAIIAAGDNIFRFSLRTVAQEFIKSKKNIVIALKEIDYDKKTQKGILEIGSDNRVLKFYEKPIDAKSAWACPPVYFLQPSALKLVSDYVARPDAKDSPGNFIAYLANHEPVFAIRVNGKRIDIGSIESYEEANVILGKEPVILSQEV